MTAPPLGRVGLVILLLLVVPQPRAEEPPSVDELVQSFPVFDTVRRPQQPFRVHVESVQKGEGAGFALSYRGPREYSLIYYDAADQTPLLVGSQDGILAYDSTSSSVVLLKQRQASLRFRPSGPIPIPNQPPPPTDGGLMLEFRIGMEPTGPNVQIDLRAVVDEMLSDEALTQDRRAVPGAVVRSLAEGVPAYEIAFEPTSKALRARTFKTLGPDPTTRLEFLHMASGPQSVTEGLRPPDLEAIATALARKGVNVIRLGDSKETANQLTMRLMMGPVVRAAFRNPDSRERADGILGVRFNWEKAAILNRTYSETIRKALQVKPAE